MDQVRGGSEEAAWELVQEYGEAIRRAVRRALNHKFRSKFDSLDFVQIVWKSFFRERDNLDRFDRPQDLVAFLIGVARNKVQMEARRFTAAGHDVRRELEDDGAHGTEAMKALPDQRPAPIEVAIARERWDRLLQAQPAECRQIVQMRLQGHSFEEIGTALHVNKGLVWRILRRLLRKIKISA
jgi:RNA polymerase sigma factor (sigma-70 family)